MSRTKSPIVAAVGSASSYCLRWNTFSTHLAKGLGTLLEEDEFTDVVLACDGKFVKAHKILLSLCSPFLKRLFKTNEVSQQQNTIVILNNVRFQDLEYIIRFVYHGEVNVQQKDLEKFLKTAELLQIEGLAQPEGDDGGIQDEHPGVTSPIVPDLQPAPPPLIGLYSHSTTKSVDHGADTLVFNNATSPAQYKRTRLSLRSTTPPRSRLQSLLTGQLYIPQTDTSTPRGDCSGTSSIFSTQDALDGCIKEEFGEPENGMFVRSEEDESIEATEQGVFGGIAQFGDTEEDQEGFQEFEQDDTMNSEEFMEHLTGASESGSSQHQQVAGVHNLEMTKQEARDTQLSKSVTILPDHHRRNLLSLPIPPPNQQLLSVTFVNQHRKFTSPHLDGMKQSLGMGMSLRDPLRPECHTASSAEEERKSQCPICFKFYKNRSSLKVHKSFSIDRKDTHYAYANYDHSF